MRKSLNCSNSKSFIRCASELIRLSVIVDGQGFQKKSPLWMTHKSGKTVQFEWVTLFFLLQLHVFFSFLSYHRSALCLLLYMLSFECINAATFWFLKAPKHNRNEWPLTNYSKCHESQIKYLQTSRHRAKRKKKKNEG